MSLKIALLTNYPLVDNVNWKKFFVTKALHNGYMVDIHYGKRDFYSLLLSYLKKRKYSGNIANRAKNKDGKNVHFFKKSKINLHYYKNLNSEKAIVAIKNKKYDLIVTALDQILSSRFINNVGADIVNVHYGILPNIKGVSALEWTYFKYKKCEISLHYIDAGIDTGAIITKKEISIKDFSNFENLRVKVQAEIPNILFEFLKSIEKKQTHITQENKGGKLYTFMHRELIHILEKKK